MKGIVLLVVLSCASAVFAQAAAFASSPRLVETSWFHRHHGRSAHKATKHHAHATTKHKAHRA
ncbi:MAG: hypothetical protein ABSE92_05825 [Terriglobales bacterium]|jgi:hypothetical protein